MSAVRQEEDRPASGAVVVVVVAALAIMAGGAVAAAAMVRGWQGALRPASGQAAHVPREIGIVDQTLIERDHFGLRLRAAQRARLERYGWADRGAGVATIPIERAMELVIARGAAAQQGGDAGLAAPDGGAP